MKNLNLKLIAAALITTMLIPMGAASASENPNRGKNNNETKISQQYKDYDEDKDEDKDAEETKDEKQGANKWDWKIEKEKAKAEWKIKKEEAKTEWKATKEEKKAEVKKTKAEVKKELTEQKTVIKQNNDKIHELREDIVDEKQEITEIINYINKNKIVISEDILKQIEDRLDMVKADIEAINSSRGVIDNIYVDIKTQLENKDADGVQTGVENVLTIQDQRYLSLQKLYDDLKVLSTLLEHAKEAAQAPAPETTPATETSTDGQATAPGTDATTPAPGTTTEGQANETETTSETNNQATANTNENTQTESTQNNTSSTQTQN